jgi:hypothetical protein
MSNGTRRGRPAPTAEELKEMIGNPEAKAKYEAELAEWISRSIKEGLRLDQARAEREATELAQKNWDASQQIAKATSKRLGSNYQHVRERITETHLPPPKDISDILH